MHAAAILYHSMYRKCNKTSPITSVALKERFVLLKQSAYNQLEGDLLPRLSELS